MKKLVGSISRLLLGLAILFAIFSTSNSCTKPMSDGSGPGVTYDPPGISMIYIQGSTLIPAEITVAVGTFIIWTNNNGIAETVTSKSGLFDAIINSNGTYGYRFSTSGTFEYYSKINPGITGKVIVK
jgi:plastocyanin